MKRFPSLCSLAFCLLFPSLLHAADGVPLWTNLFNGVGNSADYARSIVVDGSGNVCVTGNTHRAGSYADYATIKYSSAGVPLWTNLFNGAGDGDDEPQALAVDGSGNVYVTGYSFGSGSGSDYATIKYSSAGVPLWTNLFNGAGNGHDGAQSLAVDGGGNVYVTGNSAGGASLNDYATIKYTSAGAPLWTNLFNGAGNGDDTPTALAVDGGGNVYVTGYSFGSGSGSDYATIKYSSAGVPLWTNLFNGAGNRDDGAQSLAVDGSGNVYVTGFSWNGTSFDYATIKYSSAGAPLWTNLFNGAGNGDDGAQSLGVDGSGNVYVTGFSDGGASSYNYATIKYSSAGTALWTNLFNGAGNADDEARSLALDGTGNVYVTGYSDGGASVNYATIKYSSTGLPLWTNLFNAAGTSVAQAQSLAVDGSGNVCVTGYSWSGASYDYATIKYSALYSAPPALVLQAVTKTNAVLTWSAVPPQKYQIQYKTNLAQTNWFGLGGPITATNGTMSVSDNISLEAQRFYRIGLSP